MGGNGQLSNISDEATEQTNTTGVRTPILDFQAEDGTVIILHNEADGEAGIPVYASLQDTNGNDLPLDTEMVFTFESNIDDSASAVSDVRDNIQPWRARGVAEQQNEEYVDSVRVPLKGQRLVITNVDTLHVELDSSTQIDWSNSSFYFDQRYVEIRSGE